VKFVFDIETLGWLTCFVSKEDGSILKVSHSSDYGDAFQAFLNAVFVFRQRVQEAPAVWAPFSIDLKWADDFLCFNWTISLTEHPGFLNIKIEEFTGDGQSCLGVLFDEKVSLSTLLADLYTSLDKLFSRLGFIGYKNAWEAGNFPVAEYIILKTERQQTPEMEQVKTWTDRLDSEQEINILLRS
jgi:hypothetical protein